MTTARNLGLACCALLLAAIAEPACAARQLARVEQPYLMVYTFDETHWPLWQVRVTDQHGCWADTSSTGMAYFPTAEPLTLSFQKKDYAPAQGLFLPGRIYRVRLRSTREAN